MTLTPGSRERYLSAFKVLTLFFEMFGTGFKHFEGELSERVLSIGIREQIPFGSQSLYFVPERVLVIWPSGHLYVSHAPNGQLVRKETKRTVTFRHSKFNFVFRVVWQQTP